MRGTRAAPVSTDTIDGYPCWASSGTPYAMTGPEYAYELVPLATATYTATLSGLEPGKDLDLIIVEAGDDASCTPSAAACVTAEDTSVTFTGYAGSRSYVIVDGYVGAASAYTLELDCAGQARRPRRLVVLGIRSPDLGPEKTAPREAASHVGRASDGCSAATIPDAVRDRAGYTRGSVDREPSRRPTYTPQQTAATSHSVAAVTSA